MTAGFIIMPLTGVLKIVFKSFQPQVHLDEDVTVINSLLTGKVTVGGKTVICHSSLSGNIGIGKDSLISGVSIEHFKVISKCFQERCLGEVAMCVWVCVCVRVRVHVGNRVIDNWFLTLSAWNSLPCKVRSSNTLSSFKSSFKSHLFKLI